MPVRPRDWGELPLNHWKQLMKESEGRRGGKACAGSKTDQGCQGNTSLNRYKQVMNEYKQVMEIQLLINRKRLWGVPVRTARDA